MASPATPKALDGTQDATLKSSTGTVYGFAVRNTSAANPVVFRLRAISASGIIVIPISLAASESTSESFPGGIIFDRGIFEDWVSGAYEGTVFVGDG